MPARYRNYHKRPMVLTDNRVVQAARDFAAYRELGEGEPAVALQLDLSSPEPPGLPLRFGMPNRHVPGEIAWTLLGGTVVRHGQL